MSEFKKFHLYQVLIQAILQDGELAMFSRYVLKKEQIKGHNFILGELKKVRKAQREKGVKVRVFVEINLDYLGEETWAPSWFNHFTLDVSETPEYYSKSFYDFVYRRENKSSDDYRDQIRELKLNNTCLMGADEMHRWSEPCFCEHCKKQGIVKIDH